MRDRKRNPRSVVLLATIVAVMALILTACAAEEEPQAQQQDDSSGTAEPSPDAAEGDPTTGGTLTVGQFGETRGFDPVQLPALGQLEGTPALAVFDSLMRLDSEGVAQPYLAESMESDDLTTWTMTLHEDVSFSDGTPLDSAAVLYNIERHRDDENSSAAQILLAGIETLEAPDDLTIVITLDAPNVAFPAVFTLQPGLIGSPEAIEELGEDFNSNPVGAGPFILEEWVPDGHMRMVRNPDYWQEGLPYLDELVLRPMPDNATRYSSIQAGDVDVAMFNTQRDVNRAEEDASLTVEWAITNGGQIFVPNTERAPTNDVRVRRAMAHALNYEAISQALFEGDMVRARGAFSETSPYYVDSDYPEYDLELASQLVEEYETETGNEVEFAVAASNSAERARLSELVQQMWTEAGMTVEIELFDVTELVARMPTGELDVILRNVTPFEEPEPLLTRWFHSAAPGNYSRYVNPELDAAFEAGRSTADVEERREAYVKVQEIMSSELPSLWFASGMQALIMRPEVHLGEYNGEPYFYPARVWVES